MNKRFAGLVNSVWLFWVLLSVPMVWLFYDFFINHARGGKLFYWSGVFGIWLALATLAVTPIMRLFRRSVWPRWLLLRRRHMGVAAFIYSGLHVAYWLQQAPLREILLSFIDPLILIGWIGFLIYAAMSLTSNDVSVRKMGRRWKQMQRWVYLATPLALLHWFMAEQFRTKTVAIYGGVLTAIVLMRLASRRSGTRKT